MKVLPERRALVIAGSRGIGAAIVRRLAEDGAKVAFTYPASAAPADKPRSEISARGGMAVPIHAVSADPQPVIAAVDDAVSRNSVRTPAPDSTTTFAPSVSRPGMALGINATHRSAGGRLLDHPERRPAVRVCHSRPRCCRSVTYLSISAADRCGMSWSAPILAA